MRVRYLGYKTEQGKRSAKTSLTVGGEYVVLAIVALETRGHDLMVLNDQRSPEWLPASDFDLVSDEVPSNWRIQLGGHIGRTDYLKLAPGPWLEHGFLEDYWGDGGTATVAAQSVFDRELEVILRES